MRPLNEREIRASFVNCSKGEAKRLAVPRDLAASPWDDLDFLGWRDPAAPERAYLVAEHDPSRLVGIVLRRATPTTGKRGLCSLCLTTHTDVSLMTARKAGRGGQAGNSAGAYMCADLACSLYLRGKKDAGPGGRIHESLSLPDKIERTTANLAGFLEKVMSATSK